MKTIDADELIKALEEECDAAMEKIGMKFQARMAKNRYGDEFSNYWQVLDLETGATVADLYGELNKQDDDGNDMYLADEMITRYAHLIAAAPDMLKALKVIKNSEHSRYPIGIWQLINEAIEKAEAPRR